MLFLLLLSLSKEATILQKSTIGIQRLTFSKSQKLFREGTVNSKYALISFILLIYCLLNPLIPISK